jgi:hypothetical protein
LRVPSGFPIFSSKTIHCRHWACGRWGRLAILSITASSAVISSLSSTCPIPSRLLSICLDKRRNYKPICAPICKAPM